MNDHWNDSDLNDYVDEGLNGDERARLEAHVEECPACHAELDGLIELRRASADLSTGIAPARDLWPGIAMRIRPELRIVPPLYRVLRPVLAVAAAVLVLLTAFLMAQRLGGSGTRIDARNIERALIADRGYAAAEVDYETAAGQLQAVLEARRGELAPETIAIIDRNLTIVDAALQSTRDALSADPANRTLSDMVASTHRRKLEFLQLALSL